MNLKNIENNIWTGIEFDLSNIRIPVNPLVPNSHYLLHYAIINKNSKVVKKILSIDPDNFIFVNREIFISICKLGKFQLILELLELLVELSNEKFIRYIFKPLESANDWIIYYFMYYATNSDIEKLFEYSHYIDWSITIDSNYPLKIFLLAHYSGMDSKKIQILKKLVDLTSFEKIFKANLSPIIDGCIIGFNSQVLDILKAKSLHVIDAINSKMLSPLIVAINESNIELINWLFDSGANYLYATWTSPLIRAITNNLDQVVKQLLDYKDIHKLVNTFDSNKWLPAHHIFVSKSNISLELKSKILDLTSNLNSQNINGNTPIHMMFSNDNWEDYSNILKTKPIDIYIKNKVDQMPLEYFINTKPSDKSIQKLVKLISQSVLTNTSKLSYKGVKLSRLSKSKQTKLYNITVKCLGSKTAKCIKEIKTKTNTPESNIKLIMGDRIDYNLFISRDVDSYVYLLYFLEKYKIGILPSSKLDIKITNLEIGKIINFYTSVASKYPNLMGLSIFWHDASNYSIPTNLVKSIKKSSQNIIFIFVTIINQLVDHANCLIIDKTKRYIIHFEPYGQNEKLAHKELDIKCKELFKPLKYKYWSPSDYLNTNSFQMLSNESNTLETKMGDIGGFCLAWALWFFELYLRNIKSEPSELVEKSINKIINLKYSVLEYIRFYANKLRKYHIKYLRRIKYPAEKIFNINTTNEEKNYIYQSINLSMSNYI